MTSASTRTGATNERPPWTIRCPTASNAPSDATALAGVDAVHIGRCDQEIVRAEQPQLQAAGTGVDREDAHR